ncbi:MAG: phospholipid carrier-dependent glycosyltransferase [Chloroflexi bacterium]|nr:phospholipid carrier-dependent glycosyltransferase [Chloroflexota bacterium]
MSEERPGPGASAATAATGVAAVWRRRLGALATAPALWVGVLLLAIYALTLSGDFMISDGEVVFQTTVALADRGELRLACNPGLPQIVPGVGGQCFSKYGLGMPLLAAVAYRLGGWTAPLLAPPGADPIALGHFGVSALNLVLTAATGALIYAMGRVWYDSRWLGLILALLYGLTTSAWPYSKVFFSEPLIAFLLVVAAAALAHATPVGRLRAGWVAVAGAALGFAVLTKIATVVLVPLFVLYLAQRLVGWPAARAQPARAAAARPTVPAALMPSAPAPALPNFVRIGPRLAARQAVRRPSRRVDPDAINRFPIPLRRSAVAPVTVSAPAPAAPPVAPPRRDRVALARRLVIASVALGLPLAAWLLLLLWHNQARFGSPLDMGYSDEGFTTPLYVGLYGLLVSSGKSVFLYSPIVVLAVPGLVFLWRQRPAEAVLVGSLSLVTLLYYSVWWAWYGGWSWGPRFLVPLLPFLVLAAGAALAARRWARWAAVPLALAGVGVQVLGALVDFNAYIDGITGGNPALEERYLFLPWLSPLIGHARFLRYGEHLALAAFDLTRLGFRPAVALAFPWLVIGALALAVTMLVLLYRPRRRRAGGVA